MSLTVKNSLGCADDTTYADLIKVFKPDASFSVSDQSACAPQTISFTNNTTSLAPVVSWAWNFGPPGANSVLFEPDYTYTTPGNYPVTLFAVDSVGCFDTYTLPNPIIVTEPVADFNTAFPINCIGNPMIFNNLSTGAGLSYSWDFGDGSPISSQQNPVHTYTQNGFYTVTLAIQDYQGCTDTLLLNSYVEIAEPVIDFSADTTYADCPPLNVNFSFLCTKQSSLQSLGPGTLGTGEREPCPIRATFTLFRATIRFPSSPPRHRDVQIPSQRMIFIIIGGPYGQYNFSPGAACVGVPVNFSATGTNVAIYQWDLGGGYIPTGQAVSQSYTLPGSYTPVLIVEDSNGCQVVLPPVGNLNINPLPVADFQANAPVLCDSGMVSFLDLSTVSSGSITQWDWDFGDQSGVSILQNPSHFYTQPGTYDVELIVSSAFGCTDSITLSSTFEIYRSPVVDIGLSDTAGCQPLTVQFTDDSPATNSGYSELVLELWSFWRQFQCPERQLYLPVCQPVCTHSDFDGCERLYRNRYGRGGGPSQSGTRLFYQ